MDRVRLGRALGYGTRHAAKTLAAVAEAAAAPKPEPGQRHPDSNAGPVRPRSTPRSQSQPPARPPLRPQTVTQARQASRSIWKPLATFSGALWLRVTGLFFGIIALAMGNGAWRIRATVRADPRNAGHFWMFAGFALLFTYFAVSGFMRANARERRG